jgi:RNA-directed DNA polymerase
MGVEVPGFSMTVDRKRRLKPAKRSVDRLKEKVKDIFRRGRGRSVAHTIAALNPILRGWANYYRICEVTRIFEDVDAWIRRKLRDILWRQWKRPKCRRRNLMKYGLDAESARVSSGNGRGPWWNAGSKHMNIAFTKESFAKLGLISLSNVVTTFD